MDKTKCKEAPCEQNDEKQRIEKREAVVNYTGLVERQTPELELSHAWMLSLQRKEKNTKECVCVISPCVAVQTEETADVCSI